MWLQFPPYAFIIKVYNYRAQYAHLHIFPIAILYMRTRSQYFLEVPSMKNLKKLLAWLLVLTMTFTMLPVFAAADDAAVEDVSVIPAAAEAPSAGDLTIAPAETVAA